MPHIIRFKAGRLCLGRDHLDHFRMAAATSCRIVTEPACPLRSKLPRQHLQRVNIIGIDRGMIWKQLLLPPIEGKPLGQVRDRAGHRPSALRHREGAGRRIVCRCRLHGCGIVRRWPTSPPFRACSRDDCPDCAASSLEVSYPGTCVNMIGYRPIQDFSRHTYCAYGLKYSPTISEPRDERWFSSK